MLGLLRVEYRKINVDRHRTVSKIRSIEMEMETKPLIFLGELLDFPKTQCRGLRNRLSVGNRVSFLYVLVFWTSKAETFEILKSILQASRRWTRENLQL